MLRRSSIPFAFPTLRKRALFCASIVLLVMQAGCSVLFFDDFQADTVGGTPNISPPSPPLGDMLSYTSPENVKIIDSSVIHSKALQLSSNNAGVPVSFWGIERRNGDLPLYAYWLGFVPDSGAPATTFVLHAGHYASGVILTFKGGNIYDAFNTELAGKTPIGTYTPGTRHGVLITINIPQRTYDLNISEPGLTKVDLHGQPIKGKTFFEELALTSRIGLSVFPQELENVTIPRAAYIIDNVKLSQRRPEPMRN